jgi:hypothetical protein
MTAKKDLRGAVVFYVDVGQLPPEKAEGLVARLKENNAEFLNALPKDITTLWLPVRAPGLTRVEFLPLQ